MDAPRTQAPRGRPETAVRERYAAAATAVEPQLCCPIDYDPAYLEVIPQEVLDKDYGCGDPSAFVRPGDTVVDLGSGGGKICFIASQIVGPAGRVIGVDCNDDMLALARRHRAAVAERVGHDNVEFRRGLIQDLQLDLDALDAHLREHPVRDHAGWQDLRQTEADLRARAPMIADDSADCVLSNCVLNLVRPQDRSQLLAEVFRVLKRGGRAAISDIVCDEDVPRHLQDDPELWSGCISGAFREDLFLKAFEDAGFHGIELVKREAEPWRVVEGIEFRSVTVVAYKGKQGPCRERNQAVVYRGPFRRVEDDDGHVYFRGERMAVCDKTFQLLQREPYRGHFEPVEPRVAIPVEEATGFACRGAARRHPRETKGHDYTATTAPADACEPGDNCC